MSENDYVATAAAEKRLREVLADRLADYCEEDRGGVTADNLAHILLDGAKIEYKARAKQIVISLDLPDTAKPKAVTADKQPEKKCWCGGAVVPFGEPGGEVGLGCLSDISHNWQAASAESQAIIKGENVPAPPIPHIVPFAPVIDADADYEDVHFD